MYIKNSTKEELTLFDLRKEFPNVSFPANGADEEWLRKNGISELKDERPDFDPDTHVMEDNGIVECETGFQRQYVVREKTYQELVEAVREKRKPNYPPIGDQLDEIMKWLSTESEFNIPDGLKSIAMKCMAVKSRDPMPKDK